MKKCFEYALKYIDRYPKTEQELRTKLYTKNFAEEDIDTTIDILKKKWYVDDKQFCRLYLQSELSSKGKVPALVKAKLIHKGVDKSIIHDAFDMLSDDIEKWITERIKKEINKLKKKWLEWYDILVKISQKGYKTSDIKKALQERASDD